jgi:hypothetical protein
MSPLFQKAIQQFDQANAADPNRDVVDGVEQPRELVYAQRLMGWVLKLSRDASEALLLAARSQHICRWESPRNNYPMNRPGYLKWRADLKRFHAEKAGSILRELGYDEGTIQHVQALNLKNGLGTDPDVQVLEDALCLMFLQYQFSDLAKKATDEKMINAIRKSWGKMSEQGRAEALKLEFNANEKRLLDLAFSAE